MDPLQKPRSLGHRNPTGLTPAESRRAGESGDSCSLLTPAVWASKKQAPGGQMEQDFGSTAGVEV
jgi:hypothetical protein